MHEDVMEEEMVKKVWEHTEEMRKKLMDMVDETFKADI